LALLASNYTAHANIVIVNAGVEIWSQTDRIPFTVGTDPYPPITYYLTEFQSYLNQTQSAHFGKEYAVGVLISNKDSVAGGYSQGPPCTTSGKFLFL
jgi:hypothetical protein